MKEIEFRNVTKLYGKDTVALEHASFGIEKGEFVFVIGTSGSGKSTLLKLLSAQISPTQGEIWVRGTEVEKLEQRQLPYFRRQFGIMQADMGLLPDRNIYQNISMAMYATEQPRSLIKKRVQQTLNTMGVGHRASAFPNEISVGEAARVLLARAIVLNPYIMVIDEPTANLDPDTSWDMMQLLDSLNRMGVTMVVASHSSELVTILKKRVITLVAGAIVSDQKHGIYDFKAMDIFEEKRVLDEREKNKRL